MKHMLYKKRTALLVSATLSALATSQAAYANDTDLVEMGKLVVTADPFGDRAEDELISTVTILTGEDLDRRQSTTLGETLDGLPGVSNSDFGPGVGRPVIRGFSGSRVQILNNGLGVADVSGEGADHNVAIDTSNARQIEVLRGPATLLYGGNASGGVINVISEHFNPDFSDKTNINGQFTYSGNGNQRLGDIGIAIPLSDHFVIRTDYAGQRSDDFDIDGFQQTGQTVGNKGTLQNSAVDNDSFSLTGLYTQDWGFAALGYSRWKSSYGIPEVFLGVGEEEQERIEADYDRIDFRSELYDPFSGIHTARFKLAYTEFNQAEIGSEFNNAVLEGSGVEAEFENDETEARLELLHNPIGAWEGVLGLQFNYRDFATDAPEGVGGHGHGDFYVRENQTRTYGLFVLENRETDFGHLELAARIDHVDSAPTTLDADRDIDISPGNELDQSAHLGDRTFNPFSVSAGTIIDIDDKHHIRVALSRSERAPSPEQLYAFGAHAGASTVEVGDPNLDKETYTNLDIGLDRHHGPFTFNITAFYNQVSDYIYLESAGEAEDGLLVFNKQDNATFYGSEFTSAWRVSEGQLPLTLRFSADYVRAKLDDGGDLPRISPARVGLGFDSSHGDLQFSMDYQRVFNQSKTADLEASTDGYNLVSFNANWQPASLKGMGVFVKGRNLLDEEGRRHTSFLKDDTTIIGRTILAGVNFDFDI
jgi:iron complex outermembrane receptor protein